MLDEERAGPIRPANAVFGIENRGERGSCSRIVRDAQVERRQTHLAPDNGLELGVGQKTNLPLCCFEKSCSVSEAHDAHALQETL